MRVIFEVEVSCPTLLKKLIEVKLHPFVIRVIPNDKGIVEKISIEKGVIDYEKFLPKFEVSKEHGSVAGMTIPEQDFSEEEKLLQHIESFGALDLGIKKIHWEDPRITWVPENENEHRKITMNSYKRSLQYNKQKSEISVEWLRDIVIHRNMVTHLVSPLSFFRIGRNHYHDFNYSEAFLNFYLMLEGFFGNGQSKNHKVVQAFMSHDTLKYAASESFDFLAKDEKDNTHKQWLTSYIKSKGYKYDNIGLVSTIVDIRGNLSHYYFKSSRKQRDSFNEKEHESIAYITMMLCVFSTIKLRIEPFRTKKG